MLRSWNSKASPSTDILTSIDSIAAAVQTEHPDLAQQAAPDGTVTLLFSDIIDSTATNERLGDTAWMALLHEHNAVVREHVAAHNGYEVKSMGDGFMLAFGSAGDGLKCAIGIQRAISARNEAADEPIQIRIGLHTGEAVQEQGDFFGKHVNLAARIGGSATGGEILVSSLLAQLVGPSGEFTLSERPAMSLKGLDGEHVTRGVELALMEIPPVRYTQTTDGVGIAFAVHGTGPPLLHQRGWSHLEYEWQILESREWLERLGRSFTVVRYDPRGSGMSQRVGDPRDNPALDAVAVLDAAGFETASFLGAGGAHTAALTLPGVEHRMTAAVLWGLPVLGTLSSVPEVYRRLLSVQEIDPELFIETVHLWQGWERAESRAAKRELRRRSGLEERLTRGNMGEMEGQGEQTLVALCRLKIPVLLVAREGERFHHSRGFR